MDDKRDDVDDLQTIIDSAPSGWREGNLCCRAVVENAREQRVASCEVERAFADQPGMRQAVEQELRSDLGADSSDAIAYTWHIWRDPHGWQAEG